MNHPGGAITQLRQSLTDAVIKKEKFRSVCDAGCGRGVLGSAFLDISEKMLFLDTSAEALEDLRRDIAGQRFSAEVSFHCGEIFSLDSGKFDLILFLLSLHHMEQWRTHLHAAAGKLLPGGRILIADMFHDFGRFHREKVPHHGFCPYVIADFLQNTLNLKSEVKFLGTLPKEQHSYPLFLIHSIVSKSLNPGMVL